MGILGGEPFRVRESRSEVIATTCRAWVHGPCRTPPGAMAQNPLENCGSGARIVANAQRFHWVSRVRQSIPGTWGRTRPNGFPRVARVLLARNVCARPVTRQEIYS